MRISDWSSDVCSSDLDGQRVTGGPVLVGHLLAVGLAPADVEGAPDRSAVEVAPAPEGGVLATQLDQAGGELEQGLVAVFPVLPGDRVVLAVRSEERCVKAGVWQYAELSVAAVSLHKKKNT